MPTTVDLIASYLRSKGIDWVRLAIDTSTPRISIVVNEGGTKLIYAAGTDTLVDEAKNFGFRARLVAVNPSTAPAAWLDAVTLLMGIAEALTDAINRYVSDPFSVPTMIRKYMYSISSIDSAIMNYVFSALVDFFKNGRPRFVDLFLKTYMNLSIAPNPPQLSTSPPPKLVIVPLG